MVRGLAPRCLASRSVKKACSVGAIAVMALFPGRGRRGAVRRRPAVPARRTGTNYSDVGITGITPIPGLFRYPLPCPRDRPVTWYYVLPQLPPVGIIR